MQLVPRMDWDRPPYNRWSFQHIREILPTTEVWRGAGPAKILPRNEQNLDDLAVDGGIQLSQFLEDSYTDGFLVIREGAVVYERYLNAMAPRTLHISQSMSKSVTGMTAGIMVGQGLLDPTKPVTFYLPELEQTAWNGATLQHVLDMTTGVTFSEDYNDPFSDVGQVDVASGWKPIPPGGAPHFKWPTHIWELILGLKKIERPHGAQFVYRSIETDVLAFAMERVSGKRLPQLISELLWQPLGAEESANFTVDPAGYALAEGGFNACLRDYGRFGLAILNNGGGIIPENWVEASRNGDTSVFSHPFNVTLPQGAYRNCMWVEDPKSRSLLARGVFGQLIYMNWDYNMVVVKLSSWPDFLNAKRLITTLKSFHIIGKALSGL